MIIIAAVLLGLVAPVVDWDRLVGQLYVTDGDSLGVAAADSAVGLSS